MALPATRPPLSPNHILIAGKVYNQRPGSMVNESKITQFAPPLRTGDAERADQQFASEVIWQNLTTGLGVLNMDERESPEQFADAEAWTLAPKELTLPPNARTLTHFGELSEADMGGWPYYFVTLNRTYLFAYDSRRIKLLDLDGTSSLGINSDNLEMAGWDVTAGTWRYSGAFGAGGELDLPNAIKGQPVEWKGMIYAPCGAAGILEIDPDDPSTAVLNTQDAHCLFVFDNELAAVDLLGKLVRSTSDDGVTWDLSTFTTRGDLSALPAGKVTNDLDIVSGVEIWRNNTGDPAPAYIGPDGIYIHDWYTQRIYHSGVKHITQGFAQQIEDYRVGISIWDGDLWYASGGNAYQVTSGAAVNRGPMNSEGLIKGKGGDFRSLDGSSPNFLLGSYQGRHLTALQTAATNVVQILLYNRKGWHCLYQNSATGREIGIVHYAPVLYPAYVLFAEYARGGDSSITLKYFRMPDDTLTPSQWTTGAGKISMRDFASAGEVILPRFDANMSEIEKVLLSAKIRVKGCSATETVKVYYQLDGEEASWTQMKDSDGNNKTITSDGVHKLYFDADKVGTYFFDIRVKIELARGSTVTVTPTVTFFKIRYLRDLATLYGYDAQLDLTTFQPDGRTADKAIADIKSVIEARKLVQCAFWSGESSDILTLLPMRYAGPFHTGPEHAGYAHLFLAEIGED